ncbi:unnamed protein product [Penicillium salamii]|nr:unnamed protein product [Penicillium salamii]CAG7987752.1 unnamed protein product [Penicillium salamii]CAG8386381.1 unnamed protein product [Penicillium salamii]
MIPRFDNGISASLPFLASSERVGFKLYVHKITEPDRIAATTTEDIHIDKPALVCRAIASERTGYIPDFAIASGEGLNYLKVTPTGYEFDACWGANGSGSGHRGRLRWTEKDTWAVDFITPNLIASGGAGAKVLLTDKRQSDTFSEGIIHTGPISDIKATGDYLAVSGPNGPGSQRAWGNNTIRLYDLRYRKEVNGQTVPYWKRESTFFITPLHFEVYPETGLLALVDRERVPRLLSLKDGTPVQSSISKSGGASRVKFDHCNGHLTLLVSTQWGEVAEYS